MCEGRGVFLRVEKVACMASWISARVWRPPFDEQHQVDQVLGPRVEPPGPRERVGMDLLGELLGLRDREHVGGRDAGERQEIVPEDPLGLADDRVPATDIDVELRVRLPDEDRLARVAAPPRGAFVSSCLGAPIR